MLHELTFVDSVLLITVFDLAAVRGKFSCKNTPKFTARPELGRTNPPPSGRARALASCYAVAEVGGGVHVVVVDGLLIVSLREHHCLTCMRKHA